MPEDPAPRADDAENIDARSIHLMRRVKRGDQQAFRELVELHQHAVIGTCAKMLGNLDDAHDVAQQVFLRVWNAAPRYEVSARFTTWLFTILRNLVFNESRRRARRPATSLDERRGSDEGHANRELPAPAARGPDAAILQTELETAITRAIENLPEKQRLAVVLRRYEDMAYEQIAAVLRTTVPSVKSLLFRARTQLREDLREFLE